MTLLLEAPPAAPVRSSPLRQVPGAVLHALLGLPVGVALFVVTVVGVSIGGGLLPLALSGLVVLLALLVVLRGAAALERARARLLLGAQVEDPPPLRPGGNPWQRLRALLRDVGTWRAVAYALVALPWGILTSTVTVTFWGGGLGYATFPLWFPAVRREGTNPLGWQAEHWIDVVPVTLVGLLLLLLAVPVSLGVGRASAALVAGLLGPTPAQRDERLADLTRTRRQAVDLAAAERRRIERDLHDGAQQRLVGLAVTLGRAEQGFAEDPENARRLVAQARGEAKEVLTELRDLVRGLSPAVLADRGLDAALSGLAARCPVPVHVEVDPRVVADRLDAPTEEAAYFVVSEALANVAKHAHARSVDVVVRRVHGGLLVRVTDDGHGGATLQPGGGLAGLEGRLAALDGTLTVLSPAGGPTVLHATIPR